MGEFSLGFCWLRNICRVVVWIKDFFEQLFGKEFFAFNNFFFFLEGTWFGNEGIHHKWTIFLKEFLKGISIDFQSDFLRFNSNLSFDKLAWQGEKIIQEGKNKPWNVNCQWPYRWDIGNIDRTFLLFLL